MPEHADATKEPTVDTAYVFTGWTPELKAVTGEATYTAEFESTVRKYTITWKNDDGSEIDTTEVAYGETPAHADATKDADCTVYLYVQRVDTRNRSGNR